MSTHPIYRINSSDLLAEKTNETSHFEAITDINSYEYLNDLYKNVFDLHAKHEICQDISEKDIKIVKSFTNSKSFENAVDICLKLLESYNQEVTLDEENKRDKSSVTLDSKIICDCMDTLASCRVPSQYKPGFLILIVRHCYFNKRQPC